MAGKQQSATEASRTSESYPSGLGHPLWWVALGVLVLNDHVLKHAGVLPGAITGKLSDVAGLIVAPVLTSAVLRARAPLARAIGFTLVVLPFAAIKLFPSVADLMVAVLGHVGITWRLWSDPTDLFALVVLPLAWQLSTRAPVRPSLERVGVLVGGVACVATSIALDRIETRAYLLNLTRDELEVHVYRVKTPLDCSSVASDPQVVITANLFEWESCREMPALGIVPLDQDWKVLDEYEGGPHNPNQNVAPRECDAVIVRIGGAPDTVVFWNHLDKVTVNLEAGGVNLQGDETDRAIYVEGLGEKLVFGSDAELTTWQLPAPEAPTGITCQGAL